MGELLQICLKMYKRINKEIFRCKLHLHLVTSAVGNLCAVHKSIT